MNASALRLPAATSSLFSRADQLKLGLRVDETAQIAVGEVLAGGQAAGEVHQRRAVHQRVVDVEERRGGQIGRRGRRGGRPRSASSVTAASALASPAERLFSSLDLGSPGFGHGLTVGHRGGDTCGVKRRVELLTREGCTICSGAATRLRQLADELGFELRITDVDAVAAGGRFGAACRVRRSAAGGAAWTAPSTVIGRSMSPGCARILRSDKEVSKFGSPAGQRLPWMTW